jgi:hypothetical protein
MVRLTEAELADVRAQYETVLAWERLDALTAGPVVLAEAEAAPNRP